MEEACTKPHNNASMLGFIVPILHFQSANWISMIKKLARRLTAVAVLSLAVAGVQAETLSVAATPVPHAELLDFVKPKLKAEGVELRVA